MREIQNQEKPLIEYLLNLADFDADIGELTVTQLNDGGMGGLAFGVDHEKRRLGRVIAECTFADEDGTPVLASLMLDEAGSLYELDMWRVDFHPLQSWPKSSALDADA